MSKINIRWGWFFGIVICGSSVWSTNCAFAEIIPDGTLPKNSSVKLEGNNSIISGGTQVGGNLFHSFREFSVPTNGAALFNNTVDIQNIISRVTGGSISKIEGLIGANGTANLFLINPNGIIFGQGARLDIGGSFVGTTANALEFGNQGFFSASNPETSSSLLTVNPSALLFNQIKTASIQNNSVAPSGLNPSSEFIAMGLRVPDDKSLLLVGGDININGGGLFAFGGRVELGGLAGAGTVGLNEDGNNLSLSFPDSVERSDVTLSNGAVVYVAAGDGGSIGVNARNLEMTKESGLLAGIDSGLGSNKSKAGNIEVNATGIINLNNGSYIDNLVSEEASGQTGDVSINAGTLQVEGGAVVNTSTFGEGNGGNLTVNAQDVQLIGVSPNGQFPSALSTSAQRNSTGDAGDLTIKTNTLLVRDGAKVSTSTFDAGKGGNLTIDAQDVQVIGTTADGQFGSVLNASTLPNSTGNAGDLTIKTNTLLVQDGAQVGASTFSAGKGGDLTVDAQNIQLIGESTNGDFSSSLGVSADRNSTGDAGDLTIKTNTLLVRDGAQVVAGTFGAGKGGNLTVDAQNVQLIGVSPDGQFRGGLFASAEPNSTGDAGDLTIRTNTLLVEDGDAMTVQSLGTGTAGNMTLNARSIRLNNNALLSGNTQSAIDPNREQATININSENLIMSRNSNIRTNARGENVIGGNINIDTDFLIGFENSDIRADSAKFRGGNVQINAQGIIGIQFRDVASDKTSDITATGASSQLSGNVEINTPDVDLNSGLVNLPTIATDTEVAQTCQASRTLAKSSFTITGRGGLPPNPGEALNTDAVQVDLVSLNPNRDRRDRSFVPSKITTPAPEPIIEATGMVLNEKGEVVLTANLPSTTPHSPWLKPASCRATHNS